MSTTSKHGPYTPDELYAQAAKLAADWNLPEKWREDAVQEFVIAATEATASANKSVRAHQHRSGKNAMMMFLRREERAEGRQPRECLPEAKRISFDMPVPGMDGEAATLAEAVRDLQTPDPDAGLVVEDLRKAVVHAVSRLTPEEAEAVRRVCIEGETQRSAAKSMGLNEDQIRRRLLAAKPILCVWLAEYRSLAGK